jgi:hypothetical protein
MTITDRQTFIWDSVKNSLQMDDKHKISVIYCNTFDDPFDYPDMDWKTVQ